MGVEIVSEDKEDIAMEWRLSMSVDITVHLDGSPTANVQNQMADIIEAIEENLKLTEREVDMHNSLNLYPRRYP